MRYLACQYATVVQLVDTVSSDTSLSNEQSQTLQFMGSDDNSPDEQPDAHACRLKISLVMLDSPISLPWDLSTEMAGYVHKLAHVSVECRLRPDEELAVLNSCICDPADPRFDKKRHSVFNVLLCKNRRTELRARASWQKQRIGPLPSCVVELPPRPEEDGWIYRWSSLALEVGDDKVHDFLSEATMEYRHTSLIHLDELCTLITTINTPPRHSQDSSGADLARGMFLTLYGLFQGSTSCRNGVSDDAFGVSMATMLVGLFGNGMGDNLLSSLLLCMARVPALGPFMQEFVDLRPQNQRRNDRFSGLPSPDEVESSLGQLIKGAVHDLRALSSSSKAYREVTRQMANRRSEALTKELMFGGWGTGFDTGFGGWGGGWGNTQRGVTFGGFGSNGAAAAPPTRSMEDVAEDTEKQCAREVEELRAVRELHKRQTARPSNAPTPVDERQMVPGYVLHRREVTIPQISDFSCGERRLRESSLSKLAKLSAAQIKHFSTMPLGAINVDEFVASEPRAALGAPPLEAAMRFDVSAHPDARSKVALDMKRRLELDVEAFAQAYNGGANCNCRFIDAAAIVSSDAERATAHDRLSDLLAGLIAQRDADFVREAPGSSQAQRCPRPRPRRSG